jgi:hypothetical protein
LVEHSASEALARSDQAENDVFGLKGLAPQLGGFVSCEEHRLTSFGRVSLKRHRPWQGGKAFDMDLEFRPAVEAVLPGERVLRVGQGGVRVLLPQPAQEILCLFAEVTETRTVR